MVFESGGAKYVGGSISAIDLTDLDKLSVIDLNGILMKDLGYSSGAVYVRIDLGLRKDLTLRASSEK